MEGHLIDKNLFAFYLTSENSGGASELTLGYYDTDKFEGEIQWNSVSYQYMYGVSLDDIKFNGKSSGVCQGMS